MWTNHNEIVIETSAFETLDNFLTYSQKFLENGNVDVIYLMTNIEFDDNVLGLAYKDKLCNQNYTYGVVHQRTNFPDYATVGTLAHEIAHNIGIRHDRKFCICPSKEPCVMLLD